MLDKSETQINRIRVIRSVRQDGSGRTYTGIAIFRERVRIGQGLPAMDESHLRRRVPEMGPDKILSFSENAELNAAADRIFSHLQGRMDDRRALQEIVNLIALTRTFEYTHHPA